MGNAYVRLSTLTIGVLMSYAFYLLDVESTGLDSRLQDVIELSILRFETGEQKTWCLKPTNFDNIEPSALRINGHKLEDLRWETPYGRETYREPSQVLVEVENWIMEDNIATETRCMVGQNVSFDRDFLIQTWTKCQAKDSFPFGRRYLDTMVIEMFLDLCQDKMAEGYSLANLAKKYG